jgi:hypothetical protein
LSSPPPNTTPKLQPIDARLIASFKKNYKRLYSIKLVNNRLPIPIAMKQFNLLQSIKLSINVWDKYITPNNVVNYFRAARIHSKDFIDPLDANEYIYYSTDINYYKRLAYCLRKKSCQKNAIKKYIILNKFLLAINTNILNTYNENIVVITN